MKKGGEQSFVYKVQDGKTGRDAYYVSLLPNDVIFRRGLPPEAIMGQLVNGPDFFDAEHFAPNPRFMALLHDVIGRQAKHSPDLVAGARQQWEGNLFIIDGRTPTPWGNVPTQDIIGAVGVQAGALTGYQANPNYRLFTADGLMKLDPWFRNKLLEEIEKLMDKSR